MSDSINKLPVNPPPVEQPGSRQLPDKTGQGVTQLNEVQQQKTSLNVSILESAAVIIGVKDKPLSLVLSSAIEKLNEVLAPDLGEKAIQKAAESGLDVSPEATAERIVSQSTSAFTAFKAQHAGEDEALVLSNFIETISTGIEKGFGEARDILEGLDVLEGEISSDINQTFELVQEKLAAFEAMITDLSSDGDEQLESMS